MKKKWLIAGILAIVTAAVTWYSLGVAADKADRDRLVAVADQVQRNPDPWTLQEEVVTGGFLCSDGDISCNSVSRRYKTDVKFSRGELLKIGERTGWNLKVEGDCQPNPQSFGTQSLCKASTRTNGYYVGITVVSPSINEPQELSVYVVKLRAPQ